MILNFIKKYKLELIVFIIFVLTRLPLLGYDYFNTDVFKWKTRSYDFSSGIFTLNFDQTIQKYHPGVTLMWLGTIAIKVFNLYNDFILQVSDNSITALFGLHFTQKLMVVLTIGFTLSVIFYALKNLFNYKLGLIAVFLITFEPFYMGLTRVFHLEGMQSTFMLAAIIWFYYYKNEIIFSNNPINKGTNKNIIKNKLSLTLRNKRLFVAAFFSSLALLTKSSALYLIPFFALIELINFLKSKNYKQSLYSYLSWFLVTFMFIFMLWPALWVIPNEVINILYKGIFTVGIDTEHYQFYFGNYVTDPGLLFYIVTFLLRSSYWLLIGFLLCTATLVINKLNIKNNLLHKLEQKQIDFILYNLVYIFFYLIMLSIPSKKLDRYALPFLLSALLVSSFYYYNFIKDKSKILIISMIMLPVLVAAYFHPNYLAYYSIGIKNGINSIEPKWMIGQSQIISYFETLKKQNNYIDSVDISFEEVVNNPELYKNTLSVGFQEKYYTQIYPFFRRIDSWAVIKDLTPFASKTNYFVYPVWNDTSYEEDRFEIEYIDSIKINGVDVYSVYKRIWP